MAKKFVNLLDYVNNRKLEGEDYLAGCKSNP